MLHSNRKNGYPRLGQNVPHESLGGSPKMKRKKHPPDRATRKQNRMGDKEKHKKDKSYDTPKKACPSRCHNPNKTCLTFHKDYFDLETRQVIKTLTMG